MIRIKEVYKAFGLTVCSDIHLPELPVLENHQMKEDIFIQKADLTALWNETGINGRFVAKNNQVIFKVQDTAIFCIEQGTKIIVSALQDASEDKIRLFILGTCMGIILMQRGTLPLHGSTVAVNGKAYAFIGESGAGKSTVASAFIKEGYPLLTDDVIAVSLANDERIPYVIPSYPQQKLWLESLEQLSMDADGYNPLFERETKYAIPVCSAYCSEQLPLAGIFELVKTGNESVEICELNKLKQFQKLYAHTFRHLLIPRLGLLEWHFNSAAEILKHLNFYQIKRPVKGFTANIIVSNILQHIRMGEERWNRF
ncbi:aldolase [Metabacillus fastidiosus]|uniref:aldolase n=1 Tax=Metabacillus fastidiosus TaxID=1458 RepID=UPI002E1F6E7F|nr:aldolase [Metabacillus fastidiosus]